MPSEAYGILHANQSLYNLDHIKPPFQPRKYSPVSSSDLSNIYDIKLEAKHLAQGTQAHKTTYSDYANQFYDNENLEHCIKLVREQIVDKVNDDIKSTLAQSAINTFTRNKLNSNNSTNKADTVIDASKSPQDDKNVTPSTSKETSLVCRLGKNAAKKSKLDANGVFSHEWHSPDKSVFKPFREAVEEFNMIQNGDKILICLSGGKDSMSLLHAIRQYQFVAKSKV